MPLTSQVDPNVWTQITSTPGARIGLTMRDLDTNVVIWLIVQPSNPGPGKTTPESGDDSMVLSRTGLSSVSFSNLGQTDHVWARSNAGTQWIFASEKLLPA